MRSNIPEAADMEGEASSLTNPKLENKKNYESNKGRTLVSVSGYNFVSVK